MRILLFCFFMGLLLPLYSQQEQPVREFRGVWVATVANIDYPPADNHSPGIQEYEWKRMLEEFSQQGFNAVIFQVRPAADAFYKSSLEPWSAFLTGRQGLAPARPKYDPLEFFIKTTHEKGMEFHAWLNPYRATFDLDTTNLAPNHVFHQHRDWLVQYGKRFYFRPALPEVRDHIASVVAEIVENYDVDAIHFDDYFYPYKVQGLPFPDSLDFEKHKGVFTDKEDWRRQNVDLLIQQVSEKIKEVKPFVQFGISPFGVWRNSSRDPSRGSNTRAGQTCYDDLYADVLKWLRNGWLDYVVPQLYWNIGFAVADHQTLVEWWSDNAFGRNLYIGSAAYKVGNPDNLDWLNPSEIPNQIRLNRSNFQTQGNVFFSARSVRNNPIGLADSIQNMYRQPVLWPEMKYLELPIHPAPNLKKIKMKDDALKIKWHGKKKKSGLFSFLRKAKPYPENKKPYYYVLYKFEGKETPNLNRKNHIFAITELNAGQNHTILDNDVEEGKVYTYLVSPMNRQHTSGGFSRRTVEIKNGKAKKRKE